ncbi:MAG: hypothetical protein F6K28_42945, partial [Microcoleus sp. SIO2G3]|nr:hypothetical protein [Microcoleus sp. SIO2G3]
MKIKPQMDSCVRCGEFSGAGGQSAERTLRERRKDFGAIAQSSASTVISSEPRLAERFPNLGGWRISFRDAERKAHAPQTRPKGGSRGQCLHPVGATALRRRVS